MTIPGGGRRFMRETNRSVDVTAAMEFNGPDAAGNLPCPTPPGVRGPQMPPRNGVSAGDAPMVRVQQSPMYQKLRSSQDFNANSYSFIIGANSSALIPGVAFGLPQGNIGYLQRVVIYVLTPNATTDLIFSVQTNGGPVAGYDRLIIPPGIAFFDFIGFNQCAVPLDSGAQVTMSVTNNSAFAWTVGGAIAGWYHSEAAEQAVWGSSS